MLQHMSTPFLPYSYMYVAALCCTCLHPVDIAHLVTQSLHVVEQQVSSGPPGTIIVLYVYIYIYIYIYVCLTLMVNQMFEAEII